MKSFYPLSGLGYETVDTRYIEEFNRDVLQKFVSEFIVYGCRKVNNDIYTCCCRLHEMDISLIAMHRVYIETSAMVAKLFRFIYNS